MAVLCQELFGFPGITLQLLLGQGFSFQAGLLGFCQVNARVV